MMKKLSAIIVFSICLGFTSFNQTTTNQESSCKVQESKYYESFDDYTLEGVGLLKGKPDKYPYVEEVINTSKEKKYLFHVSESSNTLKSAYTKKNGYWTNISESMEGEYESKSYFFVGKNSRRSFEIMYTEFGTELFSFRLEKKGEPIERYIFNPFVVDESNLYMLEKGDLPACFSKKITDIVVQKNKFRFYELMTNCETEKVIDEIEEIYISDKDIPPFWAFYLRDTYEKVKLK